MPLGRRRHKPFATKQVSLHIVQYPVGLSPLEQLPVEILTQIFLESQNVEFTRTSRAIYNILGRNPSEWLIFEFFRYLIRDSGSLNCLSRALDTRGFTVSVYVKCLEYYENVLLPRKCSGSQVEPKAPTPYIRKRWLRPENCAHLVSLITKGQLDFAQIIEAPSNVATFHDAVKLFQDPAVDLSWPLALMSFFTTDMFNHNALRTKILCMAFKRSDITGDQLDHLFSQAVGYITPAYLSIISPAAYDSQNREVIRWAINRGLGPSSQQLRAILGG